MKKIVIVLFFLSSCYGLAQSKFSVGLSCGINYVNYRGTSILDNTKPIIGYNGGIIVEYRLNKSFSIKSGLNFLNEELDYNARYQDYISYIDEYGQLLVFDNSYDIKTTNTYRSFSLPLLLNYNFAKNKSYFVYGGFFLKTQTGYKVQTKKIDKWNNVTNINNDGSRYDFPFSDASFGGYGISFGIGKIFRLKNKTNISIEFRDDFGCRNLVEGYRYNNFTGSIRPNTFYLITSWSFDLSKRKY